VQLAKGEAKLTPAAKGLVDQLETKQYDAKAFATVCNPATKAFAGRVENPSFPAIHLEGYKLSLTKTTPAQAKFAPSTHVVRDQFNQLTLTVKSVDTLLVRAAKTDLGTTFPKCSAKVPCQGTSICSGGVCIAPGFPIPPADDAGVDNFKCYNGGLVQDTDEFGGPLMYDLLKPTHLCTPVDKQNENPGAEAHAGHLMCYRLRLTVPPRPAPAQPKFVAHEVAVANTNFPDARLFVKSVAELCVPAQKDPVP
jgi:hypothetical protein